MLEIKVLGPFDARAQGKIVVPTAAKPRQIFALLALRAGMIVPVPTLIEEIWGETPPRSALTTLQTYILQLRRLIGAVSPGQEKDILGTRYNGYRLTSDAVSVDAHLYGERADSAYRAWNGGDYRTASRLSREALDLWSGPALVDVHKGMPLEVETTCLEQNRLGLLEVRIDADLRLGRHHALLAELSSLVTRNPSHENLSAQFMIALYRAGQPRRALEIFRRLRSSLDRELGVEPSARLQRLHQQVLSSSPDLEFSSGLPEPESIH